jgi:SGNH hydrolase-like domain, acetyltransferase AlgX
LYLISAITLVALALRPPRARIRRGGEWLTLSVTTLLCLTIAESILRFRGPKLAAAIVATRTEFGLVGQDSRWIDPVRYKIRLRPNLNTYYEWRFGDIVRLNFIPKEVSPAVTHRYPIRIDAEGFRNDAVRGKIDVAALGDSFTDATTGLVDESWPIRLGKITGRTVQNYGTSGFGPQQELYALRDYALRRKPKWVVLAFCAGNDLSDAELFDLWEKNPSRPIEERAGWRLAESYRRYETFYIWSVARIAGESISRRPVQAKKLSAVPSSDAPRFDRGMFTVPLADHAVQFALFPPYLEKLGVLRTEIERSRGWVLTQAALREMKADCARNGTSLILMFVPDKAQVYWPLAERFFTTAELQGQIDFYCRYNHKPLRVEDVHSNRLAQNALLRDFCAQEGIPMLDLTASLQRKVEAGRELYFADDTHWNAAGHDIAARELAKFLTHQP